LSFTIPPAVHLMQVDWDLDARARGAFSGPGEDQPNLRNVKTNGSLPVTDPGATGFVNDQASSPTGPLRGVYWEFLATGGYDVSIDTKVCVLNWQYNAPNRVQSATAANNGFVFRLGSGAGSPPSNYKTWQISGNDTIGGQARENPKMIVIDLNTVNESATVGTFDNTDVQSFGAGTVRFNISGTAGVQWYFQRVFVLDTTKAALNIPRFTGALSTWSDIITAMGTAYNTKITDEWLKREGNVFSVACPLEFGDNSTSTQFNDEGATVFWLSDNDPRDPRVQVTEQAFRVYSNLRNNSSDTLTLSGSYDCGNSYPPWDFGQSDAAVITLAEASFTRVGVFSIGSSVNGAATFNDCKLINVVNSGANLDGSTFRNPNADHLLRLAS